jgi:hypothetical protein
LNRVELLLPGEEIPSACGVFDDLLGAHFGVPVELSGEGIIAATDCALGLSLFGPTRSSPRRPVLKSKPQGSIGPVVFEVDDLEEAKRVATEQGFCVRYEYGEEPCREVHLNPDDLFGYGVTFTERSSAGAEPRPTRVTRFQRVELLVAGDDVRAAVDIFNHLLGADMESPEILEEHGILTTLGLRVGIEIFGPSRPDSRVTPQIERKGRGAIGPLVFEVEDLGAAREHAISLGHGIKFEFEHEGSHQVHLDDAGLYGFGITFTDRRTH